MRSKTADVDLALVADLCYGSEIAAAGDARQMGSVVLGGLPVRERESMVECIDGQGKSAKVRARASEVSVLACLVRATTTIKQTSGPCLRPPS